MIVAIALYLLGLVGLSVLYRSAALDPLKWGEVVLLVLWPLGIVFIGGLLAIELIRDRRSERPDGT